MDKNKKLYKVTLLHHYFFGLFTKEEIFTNLTENYVKNMKIPFCKIMRSKNSPSSDIYPERFVE
jgi:hypothetical protein